MADWVTPRRSAARLALDSSCRASKVFSRLRSTSTIFIRLISFSSEWGFIHHRPPPENQQHLMIKEFKTIPKSIVAARQIGSLPGGKDDTLAQRTEERWGGKGGVSK